MANEVEIVVTAKDKTGNTLSSVEKKAEGLRGSLKRVGETAAGFLSANLLQGAASAAVDFFNSSTEAASDLNESLSKTRAVFGSTAPAIEAFAAHAAKNVGLSKQAALEATGQFGNMFDQLGIGADRSAAFSQQMVLLAGDLGSFNNADISEVIEAQTSAFRGEYDALQRFIPTINAAAVQTEAMRETGKKHAEQLTDQEKALATMTLMTKGAGKAQGDFARTADGAANKERIAQAQMENMSASIGQKLLPVSMKITEVKLALAKVLAEKLVPALEKAIQFVMKHKEILVGLAVVAGGALVAAIGAVIAAMSAATVIIAGITVAVGALAAGVAYAYKHWGWFHKAVDGVWHFLSQVLWPVLQKIASWFTGTFVPAVAKAVSFVREHWQLLLAILTGPVGVAVALIIKNFDRIKGAVSAVKKWIVDRWNDVVRFLAGIPDKVSRIGSRMWNGLTSGLVSAANWVLGKIEGMLNGIIRMYENTVGKLPGTPHIDPVSLPRLGTAGPGAVSRVRRPVKQMQHGGIVGPGMLTVAEHGRELMKLAPGSRVYGNAQTESMLGGGGGGPGGRLVVELRVDPTGASGLERLFLNWLRGAIQTTHGGDVQRALGQ